MRAQVDLVLQIQSLQRFLKQGEQKVKADSWFLCLDLRMALFLFPIIRTSISYLAKPLYPGKYPVPSFIPLAQTHFLWPGIWGYPEKWFIIVFQTFENPRLKLLFQYPNTYTLRSSNGWGCWTSTSLRQSLRSYSEVYQTSSSILQAFLNVYWTTTSFLNIY